MFISSYVNGLGYLCVSHSYLTLLGFHYFNTYILGSLISKCMLDLWVYTYTSWGFIHSSVSDYYFPKIMYYKTYVSCIYAKILIFDLSRWHYSWIFYSRMTYASINKFGKENPNLRSLGYHLYFSLILFLIFITLDYKLNLNIYIEGLIFYFNFTLR